jgi:exopolyphosphatase / guanosine-5'-triphosphate,3'-diphosphate pyrophosphatase
MMDVQPRYEYRVWAKTLGEVRDELQRLAHSTLQEQVSEEVYLISAATDDCNAKIRTGRMNLKTRLATEEGLELWKPVLELEFPLSNPVIVDQIFPGLKLPAPNLRMPRYSIDDFFREVISAQPQIATITARKRRTRYVLDDCLAEFTSVTIGKVARDTVAVESINRHPVLLLVRQLQIATLPNTSYVRQLKQVLANSTAAD